MNALINKIKQILIEPQSFFGNLKKETGIKTAFKYMLIVSLLGLVLGLIVGQLFQGVWIDLISKMGFNLPASQLGIGTTIFFAALGYGSSLLLSFVTAGILHVWILIFGGKENYSKTYQLYVYSSTPKWALSWIPFVGFLTSIYSLVLLIIGTHKVHNISKMKSALMYIIPRVLMGLFFVAMMGFGIYAIIKNPEIFQAMLQNMTAPQ